MSRELNRKCGQCEIIITDQNKSGFYIKHINRTGKNNSMYGRNQTEKTKKKISLAKINPSKEVRENLRLGQLGKKRTEEHKRNIRLALNTKESKKRMRLAKLGKKHSKEHNKNISKALKGRRFSENHKNRLRDTLWGNKYGLGKTRTKEQKENISKSLLGKRHSKESIIKGIETKKEIAKQRGFYHSEKARKNMRLGSIRYRTENYEDSGPTYSKMGSKIFKYLDLNKLHVDDSHYGGNGNGGEMLLKGLGFYPDYINFRIKLIIEYDEKRHYTNGVLREKDIIRQNEIKKAYPDFLFVRINAETRKITIVE